MHPKISFVPCIEGARQTGSQLLAAYSTNGGDDTLNITGNSTGERFISNAFGTNAYNYDGTGWWARPATR